MKFFRIVPVLLALLLTLCVTTVLAQETPQPGLLATFEQGQKRDVATLPNLALFVSNRESPTLFLESGPFAVEFRGWITVELRAQYTFQAIVNGELNLEINGAPVVEFAGRGEMSPPSKAIRLNRGTNAIVARFRAPKEGDAQLQVFWNTKNSPVPNPIPSGALTFDLQNAEFIDASKVRWGLQLLAEYRCTKCHKAKGLFELDAPDIESMGTRLNPAWIAQWVKDPASLSASARMPRLFSRDEGESKARDIASFLARNAPASAEEGGSGARGAELFQTLLCTACHTDRESLAHVRRKYKPGALYDYLKNPHAHYRWNPMPNFKLSDEEAAALAACLNQNARASEENELPGSQSEGKELVQTSGCLNCHYSPLENRFAAPSLSQIPASPLKGCLGVDSGFTPHFDFKAGEREALQAFLQKGNFSIRNVPHEFAMNEIQRLRCSDCHDKTEGLQQVLSLGAKLQPEWSQRFIGGEISYKPRPWLQARMPAFPAHAAGLAAGLAALHGHPPHTPALPPHESSNAEVGAKLISAAGGFSCVACHAVGSYSGGQVVESPGVNLAYSGERLLKLFFDRWLMNPLAVDPATKMPVYFDAQGKSPLIEILEGDAKKQIDAIWEYFRLGDKMPAPPLP